MANSNQSAVSDGTLALLQVSIDYLYREDISVYFNGVLDALPWEWVGDTARSISFSPAVPVGTEVSLRRTTNVDRVLHNFTGGAKFQYTTLDDNFRQTLLTVQEFQEGARITDLFNDLDMHGYRIINQLAVSGEGFIYRGHWEANEQYGVNNIVYVDNGSTYQGYSLICTRNHTSSNDLNSDFASNWREFAARGSTGPGSGDLLGANNLSDVADAATALSNLGGLPKSGGTATGAILVPPSAYDAVSWANSLEVPTKKALRDKIETLVMPGTVIMWPGKTVPPGYAQCPFVPTNVSRTGEYARVFANLGTDNGVGDGSTTFGIPYFPRWYTAVAGGPADIGIVTTGEVKAHAHPNVGGTTAANGGGLNYAGGSLGSTGTTGGPANLAAGSPVLFCIKL